MVPPFWGVITDKGAIAQTALYGQYPRLQDFITGGGDWAALDSTAPVSHERFEYDLPLDAPGKIICVGVNFPDRNAEYKDGSDAPKYMSLFPRFVHPVSPPIKRH